MPTCINVISNVISSTSMASHDQQGVKVRAFSVYNKWMLVECNSYLYKMK